MNFNFSEILKNIGGIKEQMESIRERMSKMTIIGEAGAGMVRVTVNGEGIVTNVEIDPDIVGPEGKDMIEELVLSATNDAIKKAKEAMAYEIKNTTGMNIPGLDKIFGG